MVTDRLGDIRSQSNQNLLKVNLEIQAPKQIRIFS